MHRVSRPWLKLLSAVGVILPLIMMMKRRRSSAQRSRSDNQIDNPGYLRGVHPPPLAPPRVHRVSPPSWACLGVVFARNATPKKTHETTTVQWTYAVHPPLPLSPERYSRKREQEEGVHRISSPWLKLLSAVGVILVLIMMMKGRKSSAQRSRSDNHEKHRMG